MLNLREKLEIEEQLYEFANRLHFLRKECDMCKYNIKYSEATLKKNIWDYIVGLTDAQLDEFIVLCKEDCADLYELVFPLIAEYYLVKDTDIDMANPSTTPVPMCESLSEVDSSLVNNTTFAQALTALVNLQKAFLAHIKGEL